ncbi:unnamed protein product, partial [Amoebophrya sp. A120]
QKTTRVVAEYSKRGWVVSQQKFGFDGQGILKALETIRDKLRDLPPVEPTSQTKNRAKGGDPIPPKEDEEFEKTLLSVRDKHEHGFMSEKCRDFYKDTLEKYLWNAPRPKTIKLSLRKTPFTSVSIRGQSFLQLVASEEVKRVRLHLQFVLQLRVPPFFGERMRFCASGHFGDPSQRWDTHLASSSGHIPLVCVSKVLIVLGGRGRGPSGCKGLAKA